MTTPEQFPIFVYGSLRPGGIFHPRILPYVERIKPAELHGLQLYSLGDFPGMVWDAAARTPVKGDLLYIFKSSWPEAITLLDRIEGEGSLYKRTQVIVMSDHNPVVAWAYLLLNMELSVQLDRIESNDWNIKEVQNADLRESNLSAKSISAFALFGTTLRKAAKLF